LESVQDIGVGSGRPPEVGRSETSRSVYLTFRGLNDAKVVDRDARLRMALFAIQAARRWRELDDAPTDQEKTV
jgi:hypothetical protein